MTPAHEKRRRDDTRDAVPAATIFLPVVLATFAQWAHVDMVVGIVSCVFGGLGLVGKHRRGRVLAVNWHMWCCQIPFLLALIVVGVGISESRRFGRHHG